MVSAIGPGAFLHLQDGNLANEDDKPLPEKERSKGILIDGKFEDFELLVRDLRNWNVIRAECRSCVRKRTFSKATAIELYGADTNLIDLESRLKCTRCGKRNVALSVGNVGR